MKFLLIQPPIDIYNSSKNNMTFEGYLPPLGLLYIASSLEANNNYVEVIDFTSEEFNIEIFKQKINKFKIIGISVVALTVKSTKEIIDIIKNQNPRIITIIGGPQCTIVPEKTLIDTGADYCIAGEAENVIVKVAEKLENGETITGLPGLYYKEKNSIKNLKKYDIINDLDKLAFPSRNLTKKYKYGYIHGLYLPKGNFTSIITSRGCPFNCKFCLSKTYSFKRYRSRSVENVIEEISKISEKYDTVFFSDDNFLANKKRAIEIMDSIKKERLDIEIWLGGVRVDSVDKTLFKILKSAGVKYVQFGIESGNEDVLKFYNKQITIPQIKKAVDLALKSGFITVGNFIIGAPIETEKHIQNTIDFSKKLNLDLSFFYILKYIKGSDLWSEALEKKLIKPDEYIVISGSKQGLAKLDFTELNNWLSKAYVQFYMRPSFYLRQIFRAFRRSDFRLIKAGIGFLKENYKKGFNNNQFKSSEVNFYPDFTE